MFKLSHFRPIPARCLLLHVRFSPEATAVLHCRKMTTTNYKWQERTAGAPPPGTVV
jgi:hypothetical protein